MPAYDGDRFDPPAPIATVALGHPEHAGRVDGVRLLIDSGADATLLPASAVARLGLAGTGERYRLEGFDGTASEAEAVRAVLVLLGRRFRGHDLLIDAEVGLLGRDVLTHVRLLLDGPAMRWEEGPAGGP